TKFVEIIDDGSGVFKPKNGEKAGTEIVGEGYKRERACYLAAMFLGLDVVKPTVIRDVKGREGSLQEFIQNPRAYGELSDEERIDKELSDQVGKVALFDALTGNIDRHSGNLILDENKKLWGIDHGDTFPKNSSIQSNIRASGQNLTSFTFDNEDVEKLQALNGDEAKKQALRDNLSKLLGKKEVALFFKRLEVLAQNIEGCHITKTAIGTMLKKLRDFSQKYDGEIEAFIKNREANELSEQQVADYLLEEKQAWAIIEYIHLFKKLNKETFLGILEADPDYAIVLELNLDSFEELDEKTIKKLKSHLEAI
ncbi:MAG: hypothetical protein U9P90_02400, partial [Patescibacteria group bacterium]|nr:hypothetical protein [Patescibacteria group bacterium]